MVYTAGMNQWKVCVISILTILVMSEAAVWAGEEAHLVVSEKQIKKVDAVENALVEDCISISMDELVERLKASKAIGFFTKLAIRSDVLEFQAEVIKMRKKKLLKAQMPNIKASFNGLLLKIMALLENDPDLSKKIYLARHSIFKSLLEVQI